MGIKEFALKPLSKKDIAFLDMMRLDNLYFVKKLPVQQL